MSKLRLDVICILQKSFRLSLEETEGTRECAGKPADRLLQRSQQEKTVAGYSHDRGDAERLMNSRAL